MHIPTDEVNALAARERRVRRTQAPCVTTGACFFASPPTFQLAISRHCMFSHGCLHRLLKQWLFSGLIALLEKPKQGYSC